MVIAENNKGIENLKELVSLAYIEGQDNVKADKDRKKREIDSYPVVTIEQIKNHIEGIRVYLGDREDACVDMEHKCVGTAM